MIPFKYGVFVTGTDFCGREQELNLLKEYISSSMRVYIVGERRTGKSSLLMEAARTMPGYRFIYVDLRSVVTRGQLCERIANGLNRQGKTRQAFSRLMKAIANLRPEVSVDSITGDLKLSVSPQIQVSDVDIDKLLEMAGERKTVVVLDEFQDIQRINGYETILGSMRTIIQNQTDTTYIFCGSILNRMTDLFTDRRSAFYNSAQRMVLEEIDETEFSDFLADRFESGGRHATARGIKSILEFGRGNPGDIQRLCIGVWNQTSPGDSIDETAVLNGLANICALESDSFRERLDNLSRNQILCLSALLKQEEPFTLSNQFARVAGLGSYSVAKSAIKGLAEKDVLLRKGRSWVMSNPFFAYWLHLSDLL
ncbi:MAG: ATP-binding protein [Candidatus Sabulitectum sp.]|nr:ATP-binding protein [Candidatus Sabulitectum sp.]